MTDIEALINFRVQQAKDTLGYGASHETHRPAALHRLRIACKRLRYVCEFLAPAFPGRFETAIRFWRGYQDALGKLQDQTAGLDLLRQLQAEELGPPERRWLESWLAAEASDWQRHHARIMKQLPGLEQGQEELKRLIRWCERGADSGQGEC